MSNYPVIASISNSKVGEPKMRYGGGRKMTVWCVQTTISQTQTLRGKTALLVQQTGHVLFSNGTWRTVARLIVTRDTDWADTSYWSYAD